MARIRPGSEEEKALSKRLLSSFPVREPFLKAQKDYEFLFAVMLSAQTTDESVNKATARLFQDLPTLGDYTEENREVLLRDIRSVGLYRTKGENLLRTAKALREEYGGKVPLSREKLLLLPGVGFKTSGVYLAERAGFNYIPVDTHVERVSKRLGLAPKAASPTEVEGILEKTFADEEGILLHRGLILLGRTYCKARKAECLRCPMKDLCKTGLKAIETKPGETRSGS